jgi:hypothetical protein
VTVAVRGDTWVFDRVAVVGWQWRVPLKRGDQGGSNGGSLNTVVAVLTEISKFNNRVFA